MVKRKNSTVRISCSNLRGLNSKNKLDVKINHLMVHLKSDIKIIVDAHADQDTIKVLNVKYRQEMAQYNVIGNESRKRGVTVLIKKSCGYTTANVNLLDKENTVQFDLIAPDMTIYSIVAIYAPSKGDEGPKYWSTLHPKLHTKNPNQLLIGDFNVTLDPYLDKTDMCQITPMSKAER